MSVIKSVINNVLRNIVKSVFNGDVEPIVEYAFVIDNDGNYLKDNDDNFLIVLLPL